MNKSQSRLALIQTPSLKSMMKYWDKLTDDERKDLSNKLLDLNCKTYLQVSIDLQKMGERKR